MRHCPLHYRTRPEAFRDERPGNCHAVVYVAGGLYGKAAEILGISADDAFVEASRLPPDIRDDVGNLVRMYRRNVTEKK